MGRPFRPTVPARLKGCFWLQLSQLFCFSAPSSPLPSLTPSPEPWWRRTDSPELSWAPSSSRSWSTSSGLRYRRSWASPPPPGQLPSWTLSEASSSLRQSQPRPQLGKQQQQLLPQPCPQPPPPPPPPP